MRGIRHDENAVQPELFADARRRFEARHDWPAKEGGVERHFI